jgi:hypothetical protein
LVCRDRGGRQIRRMTKKNQEVRVWSADDAERPQIKGECRKSRGRKGTSSTESVGHGTASGRAILSVCGSACSISWAPSEWPDKHLAVAGLDLCLVSSICRLENRRWSGFLRSYWRSLAHPRASVFRTRNRGRQGSLSRDSTLALTPVEPEPSLLTVFPRWVLDHAIATTANYDTGVDDNRRAWIDSGADESHNTTNPDLN